jgi:hypothetical protein
VGGELSFIFRPQAMHRSVTCFPRPDASADSQFELTKLLYPQEPHST